MGFDLLDLLILALIIAGAVRGAANGLIRQAFSLGGFIGGLFVGAAFAPYASGLTKSVVGRQLTIIVIVIAGATIFGSLSEYVGERLARVVTKLRGGPVDAVLGGGFGAVFVLISVWLIAGVLVGTSFTALNRAVSDSGIIRFLDTKLPAAPPIVARIERLLDPNGFPEVFAGIEPQTQTGVGVATSEQVAAAVAADRASTVKIEGSGCGGLVSGSGFVAASGLVITNAHVVAGIRNPTILDTNGRHSATVVVFDPNLDIAVLRTTDLAGSPLTLASTDIQGGTPTVVLGYPGGGDFTAVAAGIIDERFATGRNIYDAGLTDREIYELRAQVLPGNSGGPLVLPDGTVVGVVFARSETNPNLGYALIGTQVQSRLAQAQKTGTAVSTGSCAAD